MPVAGMPWTANFQATRSSAAAFIAEVGAVVEKVPIRDTPTVSWLTGPLPECAARTPLRMPPARPSKIWPYLSIRKLYPMSHQLRAPV